MSEDLERGLSHGIKPHIQEVQAICRHVSARPSSQLPRSVSYLDSHYLTSSKKINFLQCRLSQEISVFMLVAYKENLFL
jgi:hypothetical protein